MHFISFETSTKNFSLAVSNDHKVMRYANRACGKVLEDCIIPFIDRILDRSGISLKKIDAFAIGLGPGSFTSLRIGLSTVKALAMALDKPVIGVCTLDIVAEGVRHLPCDEICVIMDARRNMVYSALYQRTAEGLKLKGGHCLTPLSVVLDRVHGRTLFVGDGVQLYRKDIEAAYKACGSKSCQAFFAQEKAGRPQAKHLAKLVFERLRAKDYDDTGRLQPVYLYAEDCQVDTHARRN